MAVLGFRLGLLVACACVHSSAQVPPGIKTHAYGDVLQHSDITLNLLPPEESDADFASAVRAIAKHERAAFALSEQEFAAKKQRLLNLAKIKLKRVVEESFQPLMALGK